MVGLDFINAEQLENQCHFIDRAIEKFESIECDIILYFCQRRNKLLSKYDDRAAKNSKDGKYGLKRVIYGNRDKDNQNKGTDDRSMIQELNDLKILISKDNFREYQTEVEIYGQLIQFQSFRKFDFFIPEEIITQYQNDALKVDKVNSIPLTEVQFKLDEQAFRTQWEDIVGHSVNYIFEPEL